MTHVLLVGATGLVGQSVLHKALADARVTRVVAPTRRGLPVHAKLCNPVVDFAQLPKEADWWRVDAVVCTLGTTIKSAGSRAAFYQVDHDWPVQVAQRARAQGACAFALNSALGADPRSRVFYSRTKGELERDLQALGYPSLTLVRPALIGGERQASRPAERLGILAVHALGPLVPRRYRVVPAERIAHHLLDSALAGEAGTRILMSEQLL